MIENEWLWPSADSPDEDTNKIKVYGPRATLTLEVPKGFDLKLSQEDFDHIGALTGAYIHFLGRD